MDQNNFSVTFSKKDKKRKHKKQKGGVKQQKRVIERDIDEFKDKVLKSINENRKNFEKNFIRSNLRIDNEKSFEDFLNTFPLLKNMRDYVVNTDFKQDFKDFTTFINPEKIKKKPKKKIKKKDKVEIFIKPYKSNEMKDIPETKNLLQKMNFKHNDVKWLIIEHIKRIFIRDFFYYIDKYNKNLENQRKEKRTKKVDPDIKVTSKQKKIFSKILNHNLRRFYFKRNTFYDVTRVEQDWYLQHTLTQTWLDYYKYNKFKKDELHRAFTVYWEDYQKNLSNLLQKIKITFVLLQKMQEKGSIQTVLDRKKDKTDLSNPYNRLIELYSLDKIDKK